MNEKILGRAKFAFSQARIDAVLAAIQSGIATDRTPAGWEFPDEDDIVFYEVALSVDEAYLITGNTRHFPPVSKVVTPAEMLQIVKNYCCPLKVENIFFATATHYESA